MKLCSSAESEERRSLIVNFRCGIPVITILLVAFHLNEELNLSSAVCGCCVLIDNSEKEVIISHDSLSSQHRPTSPSTTTVSPYCAVFAQYYS
jgi:hypothetical protein